VVDPDSDHPFVLDQLKQLGFYTDCVGQCDCSIPDDAVSTDVANALVKTAELLTHGREVTVEEIELWRKHLQPVWKGPYEWMKQAVAAWHEELTQRGLISEEDGDMETFIFSDRASGNS
jgi:hypothetical protein